MATILSGSQLAPGEKCEIKDIEGRYACNRPWFRSKLMTPYYLNGGHLGFINSGDVHLIIEMLKYIFATAYIIRKCVLHASGK